MQLNPRPTNMASMHGNAPWRLMCQVGGAAQIERMFSSLLARAERSYRREESLPHIPQGWAGLRLCLRRTLEEASYEGLSNAICLPGELGCESSRAQAISNAQHDDLIVISPLTALAPAYLSLEGFGQISCHLDWSQVCTGARPEDVMHMLSRREIGHRVIAAVGVHIVHYQYAHARAATFIELTADNRPLAPLQDAGLFD